MFRNIRPTAEEVAVQLPGDDIIANADVTMDRAFTLNSAPAQVWPWFQQLGKSRAGWYFPHSIELFIPPKKRGLWKIDPDLQNLAVGKIIDDWGGKDGYFETAILEPPHVLVYKSTRGNTSMSWAIIIQSFEKDKTRVHLRLRLAPVKRKWLANSAGGAIDALTIAGLAAGLRQRLQRL